MTTTTKSNTNCRRCRCHHRHYIRYDYSLILSSCCILLLLLSITFLSSIGFVHSFIVTTQKIQSRTTTTTKIQQPSSFGVAAISSTPSTGTCLASSSSSSSSSSIGSTASPTDIETITTNNESLENNDIGYTLIQKELYDIVKVDLDNNRDYPIYIGTGYSDEETASLLLQGIQGKKVLIVTNDKIAPFGYLEYYSNLIKKYDSNKIVNTYIIPDGEQNKNLDIISNILDQCMDNQLDRKATLIALGGGVIGDMIGFVAAIYVRGIQFIQIPTTVMSMVDSSVGGKTGINHPAGKNMIGSFHQPSCVYINTNTLQTLPQREYNSGISEIIKYGLIRDNIFFIWLENNIDGLVARDPDIIRYAITRSCQNKATVVKLDELENDNIRVTLNLGHTFGHAIETGYGYGIYLHGEAVSIGIVMACKLSYYMNWISYNDYIRIITLLQKSNLPIELSNEHSIQMTRELFLSIMSIDKKVSNGQLNLILLTGMGNCMMTSEYNQDLFIQVIDEFVTYKSPFDVTSTINEE